MIKTWKTQGMKISQIAEKLGRDRKTIRKWLREEAPKGYRRTAKPPSKLERFKPYIRQRMAEGCLNATVLYDEIRAQGYDGKTTILRTFMQPLRPEVQAKATVRFETPPGKQAQVDWGEVQIDVEGTKKKLYIFVMTLGYSRMSYVEFMENARLETLMACHVRAMQYFGGVTETVLYDNMKTIVTDVDERGEVIWNRRFAAFAAHHGFALRRCRPYRAQTKGKVESGVKYVKGNFWPRIRAFGSLHELNLQARYWMDYIANVRIHGTTRERPVDLWLKEPLRLPNRAPFSTAERHPRRVSNDCLVSYEANRYSVPHRYVGQLVELQDDQNGSLRVFAGDTCIAEHEKLLGKHRVQSKKEHFAGLRPGGSSKAPKPLPRLVESSPPEVSHRSLQAYEDMIREEQA